MPPAPSHLRADLRRSPPISPGVVVVIEGDDILRQVPQTDCRRQSRTVMPVPREIQIGRAATCADVVQRAIRL